MSTKVMTMGLPAKSPRKVNKLPTRAEELETYELEALRTQQKRAVQTAIVREKPLEKKEVSCQVVNRRWTDALIDYADERFDEEDVSKVDAVSVEGHSGICNWELTVPNPRLTAKVKRLKASVRGTAEDASHDGQAEAKGRGKEYDFVDSPAWRICVDPNTYSYVPNNGRYRASKLVKKIDGQRYASRRLQYQDSAISSEREHLQREIHRELRNEFEIYLNQEKEKNYYLSNDNSQRQREHEAESALNTSRSKGTQPATNEDFDERYEAMDATGWVQHRNDIDSSGQEGGTAVIAEPSSILKVSTGHNAHHKQHSKRTKATILPPLDYTGTHLNGDQFLHEVSSRLLNWEQERKGHSKSSSIDRSTEAKNTQSSQSDASQREHRSKSEPPTMSELIDRHHQHRSGFYADMAQDNHNSLINQPNTNYGMVPLSVLGSNPEPVNFRLPKQRTDSTSMKDHASRRVQQSSAPVERYQGQHPGEALITASQRPSQASPTTLPPRGETLPIRTPSKALQPVQKDSTPEAVSYRTFSVHKIGSSGTPPAGNVEQQPSWDCDDQAIDAVRKHQSSVSQNQSTTIQVISSNGKVLRKTSNPSVEAAGFARTSPLNAMTVVNHIKYTPDIIVPKRRQSPDLTTGSQQQQQQPETSVLGHSPRVPDENPLHMLVTKLNNTSKPKKTLANGNIKKNRVLSTEKSKADKSKKSEPASEDSEIGIGIAGKKIGYNETTHRII